MICRVARLVREALVYSFFSRLSLRYLSKLDKTLTPLSLLLPQIIRNSRNCRVPSGNNTIFSPPFLLSFSEPEEPDHDDERLGGTSEYHATLHLEISLFLRLEYEKKKKSKNSFISKFFLPFIANKHFRSREKSNQILVELQFSRLCSKSEWKSETLTLKFPAH